MKYLLTLISALLIFTSCSKEDDQPDYTKTKATRAIMIYMAGENNLTVHSSIRYLQNDLQEIIAGSKTLKDNQRVFVFVDSLGTDAKQKGTPYIAEVHGGKLNIRKQFTSDFYSSDPTRFQEIISWMTSNIAADGFGLVLWGHACGWLVKADSVATATASRRAYGLDTNEDSTGGEKWMNITQMARALKGLPKMDFIFADCCNMMCIEVGYELRNATDYLIGSPAEIPGNGAPYDLIMPYLFNNGSELYKGIIDTYYNYYLQEYPSSQFSELLSGYSLPLSVIDTKYVEQLAQQTKNILPSIAPPYPQVVDLTETPYYWSSGGPILYDMKAIIKTHADEYSQWEQAFNLAVPYIRNSKRWMSIVFDKSDFIRFNQDDEVWGCISMYIPLNYSSYIWGETGFNKTANNFEWNRVMDWSRFGW